MRVLLLLSILICSSGSLPAGVVISFNYNDPADSGFNASGATGTARRNALQAAANNFATAFSSYTASIVMDVKGTASGSTLAAAGDNGGIAFSPGFGTGQVIRSKVLNGTDPNGSAADGSVTVNFATVDWELNIGTPPSGGKFDWYSTMYHEFAHAFGFASSIQTNNVGLNATDAWGTVGANNGEFGAMDQFLSDKDGVSVFTVGSDLNEALYESLLTGGTSPGAGLFFNGANAIAANGGAPVGLFSPTTFQQGSSGSHLDDSNPALAGSMMLAATGPGSSARLFSNIELAIFKDIGYANIKQISAVPEPSSFALGLFTMTMAGLRIRRRK